MTQASIRRPRRRGFALVLALTLVALAGVVALAVGRLFAADLKRTQLQADEAQLRQLLLAGSADVTAHLNTNPGQAPAQARDLVLPQELQAQHANVHVTPAAPKGDSLEATARAECYGHVREQELRYARDGGRWRLVSAELQR